MEIAYYIILFMSYSFIGWMIEVHQLYQAEGRYINRGFLVGPYCPIYGYGGMAITLLLTKYLNDPLALFIMATIICSIIEYFTSYFMEKIFKARWWDYSDKKFNINGRICLETLIPFGLLGLLVMYGLYPSILYFIEKIPNVLIIVIAVILLAIYIVDTVFS